MVTNIGKVYSARKELATALVNLWIPAPICFSNASL